MRSNEFTQTAGEKNPHLHEVQFYSDDAFLPEKFARFIAVALKSGRAAIVVITESHREGLVSSLKARGIDVSASTQQATYIQLDVNNVLHIYGQ